MHAAHGTDTFRVNDWDHFIFVFFSSFLLISFLSRGPSICLMGIWWWNPNRFPVLYAQCSSHNFTTKRRMQKIKNRMKKKEFFPYCIRIALSSFSYYMWMWSLHYRSIRRFMVSLNFIKRQQNNIIKRRKKEKKKLLNIIYTHLIEAGNWQCRGSHSQPNNIIKELLAVDWLNEECTMHHTFQPLLPFKEMQKEWRKIK